MSLTLTKVWVQCILFVAHTYCIIIGTVMILGSSACLSVVSILCSLDRRLSLTLVIEFHA